MKSLITILIFLFSPFVNFAQEKFSGWYCSAIKWGGHCVYFNKDGTFKDAMSNCSESYKSTGRYRINADAVVFDFATLDSLKTTLTTSLESSCNLRDSVNLKFIIDEGRFDSTWLAVIDLKYTSGKQERILSDTKGYANVMVQKMSEDITVNIFEYGKRSYSFNIKPDSCKNIFLTLPTVDRGYENVASRVYKIKRVMKNTWYLQEVDGIDILLPQ